MEKIIYNEKKSGSIEITQYADIIINGERHTFSDCARRDFFSVEEGWGIEFGNAYRRFSYKNKMVSFMGREDEIQWLYNFLDSEEYFKISAITGRAGSGKSSLVYNFCNMQNVKEKWAIYGPDYEGIKGLDYGGMKFFLEHDGQKKHILVVFDYVLLNAKKIGGWIKKIYLQAKKCKSEFYIRILLVERTSVTEKGKKPFWYVSLVEENKLLDYGLGDYSAFLQLPNLDKVYLKDIFFEYVKNYSEKEQTKIITEPCKLIKTSA